MTFTYRARTPSGRLVRGSVRAIDARIVYQQLRERMLTPSLIESSSQDFSLPRAWRRPRITERLAFFRAFSSLEQCGIDFSTAFDLLVGQARSGRFQDALVAIRSSVELSGEKLHAAMSQRPDEFSDLEVAMVAAGEEAGNREQIFDRLAGLLEHEHRIQKRLQSALLYPAIVVFVAVVITGYLFAVVVPQFGKLFSGFGVAPTGAMGALLALSALWTHPFPLLLVCAGALAMLAAFTRAIGTPAGALLFDRFVLRLPLVGDAVRKSIVARRFRVLSTLLQAGVNQIRALEIVSPVAGSPSFSQAIDAARDRLLAGLSASLEEAVEAASIFDPLTLGFIRVGSRAGNTPQMMVKIAEYFEEDVNALLAIVPTLVQTVVTIGLGAVVGLIVYVVYVPLSSLAAGIH